MNELASSMESTYSTAKICKYGEDLSNCEPSMSLGGKSYIVYYQNQSIEIVRSCVLCSEFDIRNICFNNIIVEFILDKL